MSGFQGPRNVYLFLFPLALAGSTLVAPQRVPVGLSASDWNNIRAEYERNRHSAFRVGGEYHARNPRQHWLTRFDGHGFSVEPNRADWRWGLELESYGFAGHEHSVNGTARVKTRKQRVSYTWDGAMEEWFINDGRGLEHGFTLRQRPQGAGERLAIRLAVRGGLRARAESGGQGVSFADAEGRAMVEYARLKVWDANGKILAARLEAAGESLRIEVDESEARYPITIDPIGQQAYLKGSNTGADAGFGLSDEFGASVAVSGNTVVVGAPSEDSNATGVNGDQSDNSADLAGAVYVFVRSGRPGVWSQQAYLKASNTGTGDAFGFSVAISGDTVVVGSPFEDSNATGIKGDQSDNSLDEAGAAYVFVRSAGVWRQEAYLKASNTGAGDVFGISVAVSGDTVVVGANREDSNATGVRGDQSDNSAVDAGAAYVFVRSGGVWSQQAYLKASNTGAYHLFGRSVAVSGDTVVVGAYVEGSNATGVNGNQSDNSLIQAGAAYVFVRSLGVPPRRLPSWSQQAYLKASNTGEFDGFGFAVAVSGGTMVVAAPDESSNATGVNGDQSDNSAGAAGAVYVFVGSEGVWTQQAYLKAANPGAEDEFGLSVAVSGDTVVVGSFREDSSATGVDGNDSDNSALNSGAAYVFVRSAGVWRQQGYLKASNSGRGDEFGTSVGVSGDTIVIGAPAEDSNATGVNGNQSDDSFRDAGAAYVFLSSAPDCALRAKLTLRPDVLSPPDHRMVPVTATLDIDPCSPSPKAKLVSITSNEPDRGLGDGDRPHDIQKARFGRDDRKFLLRVERKRPTDGNPKIISGNKPPGRIYTVTYEVIDGNTTKRVTGEVLVPLKSQH